MRHRCSSTPTIPCETARMGERQQNEGNGQREGKKTLNQTDGVMGEKRCELIDIFMSCRVSNMIVTLNSIIY